MRKLPQVAVLCNFCSTVFIQTSSYVESFATQLQAMHIASDQDSYPYMGSWCDGPWDLECTPRSHHLQNPYFVAPPSLLAPAMGLSKMEPADGLTSIFGWVFSSQSWDTLVCFSWRGKEGNRRSTTVRMEASCCRFLSPIFRCFCFVRACCLVDQVWLVIRADPYSKLRRANRYMFIYSIGQQALIILISRLKEIMQM